MLLMHVDDSKFATKCSDRGANGICCLMHMDNMVGRDFVTDNATGWDCYYGYSDWIGLILRFLCI